MHHPQKNIITRALGVDGIVDIDIQRVDIRAGDTVLLCTDGLTNMLEEDRIERVLVQTQNPDYPSHRLVQMANEAGGQDNVTVLLAKVAYPGKGVKQ